MIQVLLVDDEPYIRQGLRVLVDWELYGYEVVGEAKNGKEAMKFLEKQRVDLMFVDVQMPGMSGIELIATIRKRIPENMKFVILTGYADFTYAKQAVRLQVREYMLKPVQKEELTEILEKLKGEFTQNQKGIEQEFYRKRLEYDACITRLLWGKYTEEEISYVKERLGTQEKWQYVSFEFDKRKQGDTQLDSEQCRLLEGRCRDYLCKILDKDGLHVVPSVEPDQHIFGVGLLLTPRMAAERGMEPREWIVWLRKRLCQYFSLEVQAYVGEEVSGLERIGESYHSIRAVRCLRNFSIEKEAISEYGQQSKKKTFPRLAEVDELIRLVKENRQEKLEEATAKIFERIRESAMSMELLSANIYHLLYRLLELARELDDETNQEEVLQYISQESFASIALSGDSSQLTRFVKDYASYLEQLRRLETGGIAEKVAEYAREHYKEKLSLKRLGEQFYINNVYLGQLFKKRHGVSFKEYVNELRMREAVRLLTETDKRIYAIAKEVGFANGDYFINRFVQMMGTTPIQYRKRMREEERR